jgi:hypothetical protein
MDQIKETKSSALSQYVWLMRILGLLYVAGALLLFFFPNEIFYLINVGPKVFKITEAVPDSIEHFWLVLASTEMIMLSALSFLSAESPRTIGYLVVQLLAKTASTAGFIYMFIHDRAYFAYLTGSAIDIVIALTIAIAAFRALRVPAAPKTDEVTHAG